MLPTLPETSQLLETANPAAGSLDVSSSTSQRGVVLLHGLLNSSIVMWPLGRKFRKAGFDVKVCGYRSWRQSIDDITGDVLPKVKQFHDLLPENSTLDIVGHSLGSIVCRRLLQEIDLPKLRRVVMLAPPNRGSHAATRLKKLAGSLVPAVDQLSDVPESYVNQMSHHLPVPFGVIASQPDFVIHSEATHLETESAHISAPGPHGAMIFRKEVFEQTLCFLEQGEFLPS